MDNKTIESVVKDGLCTGCGSCVAICPLDAIEMVIDHHKGIYLPQLDKERCNECGICFEVCPGHAVDFKQLNLRIFGKQPEDILLGNYLNCYIGHASDYDIRYNSASGGLITALLIFALEQGVIDGALVTRMSENNPLEPQPFIARTREEIISASKSKYCPVPANMALKEILKAKEGEKFAVVGLPCHLHGIRKAEAINKKLKERIVLHLGIFCNHTPSFLATEYLLHRMKVKKGDVKGFHYRGEGWPGKMTIKLGSREIFLSYADCWASGFGSFFHSMRCMLCADAAAELADISFGDAWLPELRDDKTGKSMLISRRETGESLLQNASAEGRIELTGVSKDKVIQAHYGNLYPRKSLKARLSLFRLLGKEAPVYNIELLKPNHLTYLRGLLLYLDTSAGSKRYLWGLLPAYASLRALVIGVLTRKQKGTST